MRSVDRALLLLRSRMAARGVLDAAERIATHHGVTLLDVFSFAPVADMARRDIVKALVLRGVKLATLGEWFAADTDEMVALMAGDRHQGSRIAAALGYS